MRVVAAVAVALVLVGCSTGRPGAAVVVDGTVISTSTVDEAAEVICQLSLAQQPGGSFPGDEVRGQAAAELALALVAADVAETEGIEIRESDVRVADADRRAIAQQFPDLDIDTVVEVLETSTRVARVAEALGASAAGEEVTQENAQALQQAGRAALVQALGEADAEFSPRFAIGDLADVVQQPGSLAAYTGDDSEEGVADQTAQPLLDTQTCS